MKVIRRTQSQHQNQKKLTLRLEDIRKELGELELSRIGVYCLNKNLEIDLEIFKLKDELNTLRNTRQL